MFDTITRFAVRRWPAVLVGTLLFCIFGWFRFRALPVEAFPDVTDPMIEVVGLYPGQSAEEVERRVTLELERSLAGTPHLRNLRSVSVFGLALVTLKFDDTSTDAQLRAAVSERLRDAQLPEGAEAQMGPQATPVGQIYRYTLRGPRSLRELRAIQDFVIERRLRAVPGVADVVTFGGYQRQYQVRVDPTRLVAAGVSIDALYDAVKNSNENAGGGYAASGSQELIVRGLGAVSEPSDIGSAVVAVHDGVPIRVRDVADLVEGSTPRRGSVGRGQNDEVVEGIVLLRRGENPSVVLSALHARVAELNDEILPKDVQIATFYDRESLVNATLSTVGKNLLEGALLVLGVVYLFLRTLRAVAVVAVVLPVSMLTAFVGLSFMGLPANLISLGAIDFGILVDGAIIVVEATLHALAHAQPSECRQGLVQRAAQSVVRPVGFAMAIIIAALGPIFALERVEGRIFAPMAYTYAFALLGALASAMLVVPALESFLMRADFSVREPAWLVHLGEAYGRLLTRLARMKRTTLAVCAVVTLGLGAASTQLGSEFLPELNEGGFYITAVFPSTISLDESRKNVHTLRSEILETPEVRDVLSHVGRPEDATQAEGPNNAELFVVLAPEKEWRAGLSRVELERELRTRLEAIPGVQYNFSQPITDRVFETISGIIGQVVVKVRGEDLDAMTRVADEIRARLAHVDGVTDLALYQAGRVPAMTIRIDRDALARRGLSVDDVQRTVRIALGGEVATELWQGERRFDVTLRLPDSVRSDPETLGRLIVGDPASRATLGEVAQIRVSEGRASIWREDFTRFVALKFNVRGRDLGGTVAAAQAASADVQLEEGMQVSWGGEFQNQRRAMERLAVTLPLALAAIVGLLYLHFQRVRPTVTIVAFLPIAIVGALFGLHAVGANFSVSSAVGCIALLGQVVLSGVILCSRIDEAGARDPESAYVRGAVAAFRPLLLTTTLALLGLVPAATSHAMGSETQRPFAIAIVAGLLLATPALLCVLPLVYGRVRSEAPRRGALASALVGLLFALVGTRAHAQDDVSWADVATMARAHAPAVVLAREELGVAEARVDVAGTRANPEVSYLGYARTRGGPVGINGSQHQAQIDQPVYAFGQRAARVRHARADVQRERAELGVAELELLRRARHAYVSLQAAQERVVLLEEYASALKRVSDVIEKRASAGSLSAYDALRVELEVSQLGARLEQAQADERAASAALAIELGKRNYVPRARDGLSPLVEQLDVDFARSKDKLPTLRAAEEAVNARGAAVDLARAERRPVPTITAGGYWTTDERSSSVVFGVGLPLPIWNTGRPAIALAEREQQAAERARGIVEVEAETRLGAARDVYLRRREALESYERGTLEKLPRLRAGAEAAYQAGAASVLVLLDAHRSASELSLGKLDVLADVLHAEAEVLAAAGRL